MSRFCPSKQPRSKAVVMREGEPLSRAFYNIFFFGFYIYKSSMNNTRASHVGALALACLFFCGGGGGNSGPG